MLFPLELNPNHHWNLPQVNVKTFETSKRLVHVFGFDLLVVDLPNSKTIPAKESSLDLSPIQQETYFGTIPRQTESRLHPMHDLMKA